MSNLFRLPIRFRTLLILPGLILLLTISPIMANEEMAQPNLTLSGSTSLANLISLWVDAFRLRYPEAAFIVADSGSAVGMEALLNGSADAVLLSTPLHEHQQQRFLDRYGYAPTLIPVAHDGVAIFVNKLNPLAQISLPQLDAVFSRTLRCGENKAIRSWRGLGLKGELAQKPITTVGLSADSGAYYLFRGEALCGGDFRTDFQAIAGPGGVQAAISHNAAAIGFAGSAQDNPELRTVAVARDKAGKAVLPTPAAIRSQRYPLARTLSIAYNLPPEHAMPLQLKTFIEFILSVDGQDIAAEAGYVRLAGPQ